MINCNLNPVIIVLAYNRAQALSRLLQSIEKADYHISTTLVISIEGNASNDVVQTAENFESKKLNKLIIKRREKLGLRNHVIACGDLINKYDAVIILEDDLVVDRYFYRYACDAIKFYNDDESIAGIALYSHEYNEFSNLPFRSMRNGYATYPMQLPCSWGQCWNKKQWLGFKKWYKGRNQLDLSKIHGLPDQVKGWPESSWKKYFHSYIIENDLYFMYPYESYSTNCSDAGGMHITNGSNIHQVSLATNMRPYFSQNFCPRDNKEVSYDAFMEPNGDYVYRVLGMDRGEVTIDLQMIKPIKFLKEYKYALTLRNTPNKISQYSLNFRPVEVNFDFQNSKLDLDNVIVLSKTIPLGTNKNLNAAILSYFIGVDVLSKQFIFSIFRDLLKKIYTKNIRSKND